MPRLLALEWDSREARVAVARTRGKDAVIEHAFSVELTPRGAGEAAADVNVGERIAAALAARRIGRCETLVAVGRSSIELRRLSLPPAPPEELPDLVRFQAMRDFAGVGEDWPLDFVPLEGATGEAAEPGAAAPAGTVGVLAAVIAPKLVEQIRQTCEAAGLTPERLVLRPFAAASLLRRARPSSECRLLVDLLGDEADLTVLIGDHVVFVRTVRLPAVEDEALVRAVLGETRRTIAAAQNQLGGRRVERVVVCGEQQRIRAVQPQVQEQLAIEVEPFDPFSAVEIEGDLRAGLPDHPGRFAPLLGMLRDEAAQSPHDIDFLNPRRRPEPPSKRRQYALIAATAVTLILASVFLVWDRLRAADDEIRELQARSKKLDTVVREATQLQTKAEEIDKFVRGDVTWLDELNHVSQKAPPNGQVEVARLRAMALPDGGGQVILDGYAKDAENVAAMARNLKDGRRDVNYRGAQATSQRADYPWRFDNTTIIVAPPELQPAEPEEKSETRNPQSETNSKFGGSKS